MRSLPRALTLAAAIFASSLLAESYGQDADKLASAASAARDQYKPASADDVTAAKSVLDAAIAKLDNYLASLGKNGESWKQYLMWPQMEELLTAGSDARATELRGVALQYFADHPGLELPQFRAVGNALRNYANLLYASREENLAEKYTARVEEVAKQLPAYLAKPTEAEASSLASSLRWLARYGKPTELLTVVREEYSKPNVFLHADEELIVYGVRRDLNENTPVNDMIMGTRIRGSGHTVGRLDAQLQPSSGSAKLDLILTGTTASRTVGSNRSALIYSSGMTTISGFKRLTIDEQGIKASPSTADAQTDSKITGIGSTKGGIAGCIVTKVATKKAAESKGQATAIATRHAEARIRDRLDQEAARQLEVSNRDLRVKFKEPLQRSGTYPHLIRFDSTDDDLNVTVLEAGWTQLGAPNDPPKLASEHALTLVAHESAVNNAGNTMFAGRTLHDYEIRNEIIRRKGSLPDDMKDDEDRDPWSISFAEDQPIHFQIADGGFNVLLKFRQFTSGERELKKVNIAASYKAEREGTRLVFVRQGDLVIRRDGEGEGERIPIGEVALRSILRKKFSKLFKERIEGEGLELPGKYKSLGKLPLGDYIMEGGWAAVGWDMPDTKVASSKPTQAAK